MTREMTSEELMRLRLASPELGACDAWLHDDDTSGVRCQASPHGADQVHLAVINDDELNVHDQLIQWHAAPVEGDGTGESLPPNNETQENRNGYAT